MQTAQLVPVSQWVYDLYKVSYWTREGGTLIRTHFFASSSESHMWSDANEVCPFDCQWMSYEIVKTNVGHPRIIGNLHGLDVYETSTSHAKRLTAA